MEERGARFRPTLTPQEEKKWTDIAERRLREQQNYARSQKSSGSEMANPKCYLDVSIEGIPIGRIYIELFSDTVPMTAENFRGLCTGEYGYSRERVKLDLIDSVFHRVHTSSNRGGGYIIGGDIVDCVGSGGASIYGAPFPDESFKHRHTSPGLLSMASKGPNSNKSQFVITTAKCPHLDYKNVIFGKVTDGLAVVERMEQVDVERNCTPKQEIRITFCGQQNKTLPYDATLNGAFKGILQRDESDDGHDPNPESDDDGVNGLVSDSP
eukprot:TRINITY_DN27975_c0_g1_i1.p1 TRINITY_DN27975_c0_g1~~TRINITY_DN27975_c0_g1_i1.p1  ORF type:complete len:268 (+),score=102.05 TRINITY_DN27975_c0_g1_i1:45-848(+)